MRHWCVCFWSGYCLIDWFYSKGTMINFSVSRPVSMSKPMRACENKKQSPQNKHAYPYTHTCNPTFIFVNFIRRRFFCWFLLSASPVLGMGLPWRENFSLEEEKERERPFLFAWSSRRCEKYNKGREFWEAASWKDPKFGKTGRDRTVFFFSRPALKINARGGRETKKKHTVA